MLRCRRILLALLLMVAAGGAWAQKPGRVFRDCPTCPQMVEIPPGRFAMGVPRGEEARFDPVSGANSHRASKSEPVTEILIKHGFAIGKFELTRGEFAEFVRETSYVLPDNKGCWNPYGRPAKPPANNPRRASGRNELIADASWQNPTYPQTDRHPVVCVAWADIQAYLAWLSKKTGKTYRLPSESEWEYAARAGTNTVRPWETDDNTAVCRYANLTDLSRVPLGIDPAPDSVFQCNDRYPYTAPVGSFPPNKFGLHDMIGNIWEVTADCWVPTLEGIPRDGSPRTQPDCKSGRPARGSAFDIFVFWGRVGYRSLYDTEGNPRFSYEGFRVARSLDEKERAGDKKEKSAKKNERDKK